MQKNFRCLIIGFGSIGKKHAVLLSKLFGKKSVFILTKKKIKIFKTFNRLQDIIQTDFDYIVICSPPSAHYKQIEFIEKNYKGKTVLVEKPLLNKYIELSIKNNKFFVGYNFRFHPLIIFLKKKIELKKVFSVTLNSSSFLPEWRKGRNYRNIYSSKKNMGGGVLLDLSHELDYFQFLFGKLKIKNNKICKISKISNLDINVEDNILMQGKINKINYVININFFSKNLNREIIVETLDKTIKLDLIKYIINIYSKKKNFTKQIKFKKINTYLEQHLNILNINSRKKACSFDEGLKLISFIDKIKYKKNVE